MQSDTQSIKLPEERQMRQRGESPVWKSRERGEDPVWKSLYRHRWLYLLMLPGVLYYLIYHYVPMAGLVIAFKDYQLMDGIWGSPWVGLDNFRKVFSSPDFPLLLRNTFVISVYRILFNMLPDVALALILNEIRVMWFKKLVQTITYGPYFLSWIIVYGLVFSFFAPGNGLITVLFRDMGWGDIDVLTQSAAFRPMLIITDIWKNTGYGAIIYLAAIASINQELYEAAVVDGAGRWRQLWHITLPGIREVFVLLLILRIGHILVVGVRYGAGRGAGHSAGDRRRSAGNDGRRRAARPGQRPDRRSARSAHFAVAFAVE